MFIICIIQYDGLDMSSQDSNGIKIKVGIQYLKDLSIENINAPNIFMMESTSAPTIDVKYDVSVSKLAKDNDTTSSFEVSLSVVINSKIHNKEKKEHTGFICEAKYAGLFSLDGTIDSMNEKKILFIYAPNMLFPFLRNVIATATRDCGFPTLLLDPVDFAGQFDKQNPVTTKKD